jgi:hypothetical protein
VTPLHWSPAAQAELRLLRILHRRRTLRTLAAVFPFAAVLACAPVAARPAVLLSRRPSGTAAVVARAAILAGAAILARTAFVVGHG